MYQDEKTFNYVFAPYILEDEGGLFTLEKKSGGWFGKNSFWKVYQEGSMAGKKSENNECEFDFWRKEGGVL
ncbi:MAG: hypothetical protein PHE70_10940 [Tepidanaerobacteraceae bacterium]|nr:hypothetical protein [Tepidanaerobacteraceae bacterium]